MRNGILLSCVLAVLATSPIAFGAQSIYDSNLNIWTLSNGSTQAVFQLTPEGRFLMHSISDLSRGDQWAPAPGQPTSPIRVQAGDNLYDARGTYFLLDQYYQNVTPSGVRQYIVLEDTHATARITVILEMYDGQPV